ncbi:MAG TPA: hypothetical protein VLK84_13250 [Longimicrobium sp.]|nr:hypothetical protein [Longimicrobium sp.]
MKDKPSLERALNRVRSRTSLVELAQHNVRAQLVAPTEEALINAELVAGKGIDLTGGVAHRDTAQLTKEVENLFRRVWHYFDKVILPDQALLPVIDYNNDGDLQGLVDQLAPFIAILRLLKKTGGRELVTFKAKIRPCCLQSFEAMLHPEIIDAGRRIAPLVNEIARDGKIGWSVQVSGGRRYLVYTVEHPWFEKNEVGVVSADTIEIPKGDGEFPEFVATQLVNKYLDALGTDFWAAKHYGRTLGATVPFYERLLAPQPEPDVNSIAFQLSLPISTSCSLTNLIQFRSDEQESFERFQSALRLAIAARANSGGSADPSKLAAEIKRDVIDPELRRIRDRLKASKRLGLQTSVSGIAMGTVTASVGLISPLQNHQMGAGLTVAGAVTLGAAAVKKAVEDHFSVRRDVSLSDMYFLWRTYAYRSKRI